MCTWPRDAARAALVGQGIWAYEVAECDRAGRIQLGNRKDSLDNGRSTGNGCLDPIWSYKTQDRERRSDGRNRVGKPLHSNYRAHITIPHRVKTALRRRLINLDEVGFVNLILQIERRLRPVVRSAPGAAPRFVAIQRRYRTQRSQATVDAVLEFDLRTALGSPRGAGRATVKCQPEWLQSAFQVLAQKRSNYTIGVGAVFPYRDCPSIRQQRATDLIAQTWIACKPLLEAMLREQGR